MIYLFIICLLEQLIEFQIYFFIFLGSNQYKSIFKRNNSNMIEQLKENYTWIYTAKHQKLIILILQESYLIQILNINYKLIYFKNFQNNMTSFNVESQFLDLKKTYQNFEYQQLQTEGIVKDSQNDSKDIYQGMTQNTYLFVQQKTVLIKDIQNIATYFFHKYCSPNPKVKESAFQKFPFEKVKDRVCFIFQKYQQQPTLLDTLLENLIKPIMDVIKVYLAKLNIENEGFQKPTEELHAMTMIIYQLSKVRGKKWVIQYFPHQVKDLYPVLGYLARQKNDVSANWETRYIVLLWLGVIALVPFNLDIIDSGVIKIQREEGGEVSQIVEVMIQIGKHYLKSLTKMREAAALFIGKLFTRPDIQKRNLLPQYIKYVVNKLNTIKNSAMDIFFVCGLYHSLYHIFKRVQRNQLLPLIGIVLNQLKYQRLEQGNYQIKSKIKIKQCQI